MHDGQTSLEELRKALAQRDAEIASRDAEIARLTAEVTRLTEQVQALQERLGQDSSNSSKPPSSDGPTSRNRSKQARRERKSGRKRGGQKGHKGHRRALLPESEVNELIELYPAECENCWKALPEVSDPYAKRHQVTELPPVKAHTTEYRRHKVRCPHCNYRTRAKQDERVPKTSFGPRLSSILAMLTGVYHLSRRQAQRVSSDLFGVRISLGALSAIEARVSDAIKPVVDEAWAKAHDANVKYTDGTSWKQAGVAMQLWTLATTAVTVFKIILDGSKETLKPLFGKLKGILHSDRAKALNFWAMAFRQICWAHLLRKFVSFSERDGPAGHYGRQLLEYTGIIFSYWQDIKSGSLSRNAFVHRMAPLRQQVESLLEKAVAANIPRLSGSCADILAHRAALWTFVEQRDVEPTNNHAEQELRAFVLWRRRSFGSQSTRGNEFAENIMTVAHTARKQRRHILTVLTDCVKAQLAGISPPSLFSA